MAGMLYVQARTIPAMITCTHIHVHCTCTMEQWHVQCTCICIHAHARTRTHTHTHTHTHEMRDSQSHQCVSVSCSVPLEQSPSQLLVCSTTVYPTSHSVRCDGHWEPVREGRGGGGGGSSHLHCIYTYSVHTHTCPSVFFFIQGGQTNIFRNRGGRRLQLKCIKLKLAKAQVGQDHFQGGVKCPPSNPLEKNSAHTHTRKTHTHARCLSMHTQTPNFSIDIEDIHE